MAVAARQFGPFALDLKGKQLFCKGKSVPVGRRAFDLMLALVVAQGWPVSKAELMDAAWPGLVVEESNLNVQIAALRKALAQADESVEWIVTIPRFGYRVHVPESDNSKELSFESSPATDTGSPAIAVLPFENFNGQTEHEFFAQGITSDLTTELGRLRHFTVIAGSSMSAFRDRELNLPEIGAKLGIRYFLSGNIRVGDGSIRVSAQLLEANTGVLLWGEKFDRTSSDMFTVQDEITRHVVREIGGEVLEAEFSKAVRKPPANLNAWECYVRAMLLAGRLSDEDSREALVLLTRANQLDQFFARALGLQAWILLWRAVQGWHDKQSAILEGSELALRALQADDREPWAWIGQGMKCLVARNYAQAISSLQYAVELSPSFALGWGMLGLAQAFSGEADTALQTLSRVNRLSPREIFVGSIAQQLAFAHFIAGSYEDALSYARQAHALRPNHVYSLVVSASAAGHLGKADIGSKMVEALRNLSPQFTARFMLTEAPFEHLHDRERLVAGLVAAGLS